MTPGRLVRRAHAGVARRVPDQHRAARQGQHRRRRRRCTSRSRPASPGSSCTRTGAPPPRRSTPACGWPTRPACRSRSTPTRSTRPATCRTPSPRSPGGASTRTTPRARAAGTRRTSSPWRASRTCCRPRPTRPARTPSTPSTSTSTCSWSATTSSRRCPRTWRSPRARIRPSTIAAEDLLHDLGAISMIGSDSQAMGRVGEVPLRTWQTAHVGKKRWGALPGDGAADNLRAQRYVAKYTICPAIAHGLDGEVGSVEVGKLADLVLYQPAFFGVRPVAGDQGRDDRLRGDGRRQRVDPDAAAGAAAADVRCRRAVTAAATSVHFVAPAGARGRAGRPARGAAAAGARARHAVAHQGRHARQRRAAADRGGARHVHRPRRRRGRRGGARRSSCRWPSGTSCSEPATTRPLTSPITAHTSQRMRGGRAVCAVREP